jgi:hypothetical protein
MTSGVTPADWGAGKGSRAQGQQLVMDFAFNQSGGVSEAAWTVGLEALPGN